MSGNDGRNRWIGIGKDSRIWKWVVFMFCIDCRWPIRANTNVVYVPMHCATILQLNCEHKWALGLYYCSGQPLRTTCEIPYVYWVIRWKTSILGMTVVCHLLLVLFSLNMSCNIWLKEAQLRSQLSTHQQLGRRCSSGRMWCSSVMKQDSGEPCLNVSWGALLKPFLQHLYGSFCQTIRWWMIWCCG